ncbi:nitroreductase family protein [Candidatus Pantoea multigeneris]|nr:SagB family peptide dehydrogenase [Pantoea multigeneris]
MSEENPKRGLPENLVSTAMSANQFNQNEDLQVGLPQKPRLIPELIWVPVSPTSLTLYGSQIPRTLHCAQGIPVLKKLLSLLDGSKTLDQLERLTGDAVAGGAIGFISLLFRYGLLEESDSTLSEFNGNQTIAAWYGRFIGNTRKYSNRANVVGAMQRIVPLVIAPAALCDALDRALDNVPFADAHVIALEALSAFPTNATHALFICTGEKQVESVEIFMDAWLAAGLPYFCVRIGLEEVQQGPYVVPGYSATHRCASRQLVAPGDQNDELVAAWWAVLALHEFTQLLSGLTRELYINTLRLHDLSGKGGYIHRVRIARLWGTCWENNVISPSTEGAYISWLHHVSTRPPPHEYLAPTLFQTHFALKNIKLYAESGHALLPASEGDSYPAPTEDNTLSLRQQSADITPAQLFNLLQFSGGQQKLADGSLRRIAPSAGSLQSVSFYVVINAVEGMNPGIYYYNGENHQLERITIAQYSALLRQLYGPLGVQEPDTPAATILISSYLARLRDKYDDFGLNLAFLDSGVAASYLNVSAAAMGWHICEATVNDYDRMTDALFQAEGGHEHIVASVFHLFSSDIPASAIAVNPLLTRKVSSSELLLSYQGYCGVGQSQELRTSTFNWQQSLLKQLLQSDVTLESLMLNRRAQYGFGTQSVPADVVIRLVALMLAEKERHSLQISDAVDWQPWVILPGEGESGCAGVFACTGAERAQWVYKGSLNARQLTACVNQTSFARSGVILLVVAPLASILTSRGKQGYLDLQRQAGAAVALAWLGATDAGLIGAPCGGFLEHGLRQLDIDGFHNSVMFSLVLGQPGSTAGETDAHP